MLRVTVNEMVLNDQIEYQVHVVAKSRTIARAWGVERMGLQITLVGHVQPTLLDEWRIRTGWGDSWSETRYRTRHEAIRALIRQWVSSLAPVAGFSTRWANNGYFASMAVPIEVAIAINSGEEVAGADLGDDPIYIPDSVAYWLLDNIDSKGDDAVRRVQQACSNRVMVADPAVQSILRRV